MNGDAGVNEKGGVRLPMSLGINSSVPLFQFDLNFDSLKSFLDMTTQTINQHAELINALQGEIQKKIFMNVLPEQLSIIGDGGEIMNSELANSIKNQVAKSARPVVTGESLSNATNKVFNRLSALGYAVAQVYQNQVDLPARLDALGKEFNKCAMKDDVKEKHKSFKTNVEEDLEEIRVQIAKKIADLDTKFAGKISTFEDKVQAVEKKTLWKITDIEEMMKKRITQEYVDESCRMLEEKLRRELFSAGEMDADKVDRTAAEITQKMKVLEDTLTEKNQSLKKNIKDVEQMVSVNCAKTAQLDELKKNLNNTLEGLERKQKELESSLQIQQAIDRQNIRVKAVEEKISDLQENLTNRIQDLTIFINNQGGGGRQGGGGDGSIDPHKLCQMEGDILRAKDEINKHAVEIDKMKDLIQSKLDNLDVIMFESMNRGGGGNSTNNSSLRGLEASLQELREQMATINQQRDNSSEPELRRLAGDVREINKKIESIRDLEKRIQRIFKEFDFNALSRQLKSKSESDDVLRDFAIADTKLNANSEQIAFCRKDIDNLLVLYKKYIVQQQGSSNSSEIGSLLSTKKLYPVAQLNCLSCGITRSNQSTHIHSTSVGHQQVRGSDGKNYRIDLSAQNEVISLANSFTQPQHEQGNHISSRYQNVSAPNSYIPLPQQTTKLSRPSTATVRSDSQGLSITVQSQSKPITAFPSGVQQKRPSRPESAKK